MLDNSAMLDELCNFSVLHSRAQRLDEKLLQQGLAEIAKDAEAGLMNWTAVWTRLGEEADAEGNDLEAVKLYNLARFPFVDGPSRRQAHGSCVESFRIWAEERNIERWDFKTPDFSAYVAGADGNRPVVLVSGGIVAIKEQWHALLANASLLGRCVVVTEMAQVGENHEEYSPLVPTAYSRILDRLKGRADTSQVHLLAFSFSGHLALRAAVDDRRIRRVTTVGAPVHHYFTDAEWHQRLPLLTRTALAHMLDCPMELLFNRMQHWALTPGELRALDIPIDYLASSHDEVIPPAEYDFLRENLSRLNLLLVDDVHGSPNHARLTALWVATCVLRSSPARWPWKAWLTGALLDKQIRQAGARLVTA